MVKDSDLSEYELLRLENIRRNAEFLAQLGIQPLAVKVKEQKDQEESIKKKKKAEKVVRNVKPTSPIVLRRSSRNSGKTEDLAKLPDNWNENGTKIKVKAEKAGISYEDQPMVLAYININMMLATFVNFYMIMCRSPMSWTTTSSKPSCCCVSGG